MGQDTLDRARAAYESGDPAGARALALEALEERPHDPELLHLLGRTSLETGDDGRSHLRRLVELAPEDAAAWRDLGLSLLHHGSPAEAATALRRSRDLDPDDLVVIVNLAHVAYVVGDRKEAVTLLEDVAARDPDDPEPLRHLVDMYRAGGDLLGAQRAAEELAERWPGDVRAALDLADVRLQVGDFEGAAREFGRLRTIDTEPGHLVYAHHGLAEAAARAGRWRQAMDRAIDATSVDRHQLTTDLLACAATQLFGPSPDRPAPAWEDLQRRLAEERAEHRWLHEEL